MALIYDSYYFHSSVRFCRLFFPHTVNVRRLVSTHWRTAAYQILISINIVNPAYRRPKFGVWLHKTLQKVINIQTLILSIRFFFLGIFMCIIQAEWNNVIQKISWAFQKTKRCYCHVKHSFLLCM